MALLVLSCGGLAGKNPDGDPRDSSDLTPEGGATTGDADQELDPAGDSTDPAVQITDGGASPSGAPTPMQSDSGGEYDGGSSGGDEQTSLPCNTGDEHCTCYGNDTCNSDLACVSGTCVVAMTTPNAVPDQSCPAKEVGCPCAPGDLCNRQLECFYGTCVEPDATLPPAVDPEAPTGGPPAEPDPLPGQETVVRDVSDCVEYRTIRTSDCEVGYFCEDGYAYGQCFYSDDGVWACVCDNAGLSFHLEIPNVSAPEACEFAYQACDVGPEFTSGPQCTHAAGSWRDPYCGYEERCTSTARFGTASGTVTETMYLDCTEVGDTTWNCRCAGNRFSGAYFDVSTESHASDVCPEARTECPSADP